METNLNQEYIKTAAFMQLIAEVSKSLSVQSINKAFSGDSFEKVAKCKNTGEFVNFLQSLELPELKGKLVQRGGSTTTTSKALDKLLMTGQLPTQEEINVGISELTHPSRDLINSVANGAVTGAAVGVAYGTVGGAISGGIGALPGAIGGAIAGGIGGAIGGVINWATGADRSKRADSIKS